MRKIFALAASAVLAVACQGDTAASWGGTAASWGGTAASWGGGGFPLARETPPVATLPASLSAALARAAEDGDWERLADTSLPRLYELTDAERELLVARLAEVPIPHRVAAFAFLQVGTPYVLGPLGEEEPPDTDPLVVFDKTDCAVVNLVSEALAHALEEGGVREAMKKANYRDGRVSYATRLHFTTDRLDESPYDRDVTAEIGGDSTAKHFVRLNRKKDGGRWIPIDWERGRMVRYIPFEYAGEFPAWFDEGKLPEAVGVAFVRRSLMSEGLDVIHESMLWRGRRLLHGSSAGGRVVVVNWSDFVERRKSWTDGVVLFEYR